MSRQLLPLLLICFLSSTLTETHALASSICDFDGDNLSEIPLVKAGSSGNYDWVSFNPRTGTTKTIVEDFGNASSKLIPGNWFQANRAVAAIVSPAAPGPTGRATWMAKSVDYDGGQTFTRSLGRPGDIIIQGGDYDGNGVTDSLILKKTTGKLGLRVNYFLSSYNGNNLGKERLYKALGSPFADPNFFFSPDGSADYLAVLRRGSENTVLKLKPFTDSPQAFSLGSVPGGSLGPLPIKQGMGNPDLLAFYARRGEKTEITVKTVGGLTMFSDSVPGSGTVTVGDYLRDRGWEIAVRDGISFNIVNPRTKRALAVEGPSGQVVSCVSSQSIN